MDRSLTHPPPPPSLPHHQADELSAHLRLAQGKLAALEATLPEEVAAAQTALAEARHRCEEGEATVRFVWSFRGGGG